MNRLARIDSLTASLAKSRAALLRAADGVPAEAWKSSPGNACWSAAELTAHLIQVERSVIAKADRILQHPPKPVSLLKRFHLPMALVESRLVRRKSPVPLETGLLKNKEEMLGELRVVRERTQAFLAQTRDRDLGDFYWQHPALGSLNVYSWIKFLSAHEIRHAKQLHEISGNLPMS